MINWVNGWFYTWRVWKIVERDFLFTGNKSQFDELIEAGKHKVSPAYTAELVRAIIEHKEVESRAAPLEASRRGDK
jgi:hypothetical protein